MKKINKKLKVTLIILLSMVLIFISICIAWFVRYNILFAPYKKNSNFVRAANGGHNFYTYETNDVCVDINLPRFLEFGGVISSITTLYIKEDGSYDFDNMPKFNCRVLYHPKLFGESYLHWQIRDYDAYKDSKIVSGPSFITDTNLELIEAYQDEGPSELTYDDCYEDIKEYYNKYIVDICDNKAFQKVE